MQLVMMFLEVLHLILLQIFATFPGSLTNK